MKFHNSQLVCILLCSVVNHVISFELGSIKAAVIGLGSQVYQKTVCNFKECCSAKEIPGNFDKLESMLHEHLHGQHLMIETVINTLRDHWNGQFTSPKALTLSFHGWSEEGKNNVSRFIKESLYASGSDSNNVHHFMGRMHFPHVEKTLEYQNKLYNWIKGNVTRCPKQLFIFDEVDQMPPHILDVITSITDLHHDVDKVDYRQTIFVFFSNTGTTLIADKSVKLWQAGVRREDVSIDDFQTLITESAFNEQGGFRRSDTIKNCVIDHYIPFLPLKQDYIKLYIIYQFKLLGVPDPQAKYIEEVLEFVEWGRAPYYRYSYFGFKRLTQLVAMVMDIHGLRRFKTGELQNLFIV